MIPYELPAEAVYHDDLRRFRATVQKLLPNGWTAGHEGAWGPAGGAAWAGEMMAMVRRAYLDSRGP